MRTHFVEDTITLDRTIEKLVKSESAKLTVGIRAIVEKGHPDEQLQKDVRNALRSLIDVEWTFSQFNRSESVGMESASLTATARIKHSDNVDLDGRAKAASKAGLEISIGNIDDSIGAAKVREIEAELRQDLYKLALEEAAVYNKLDSLDDGGDPTLHGLRAYRVHSIRFSNASLTDSLSNSSNRTRGALSLAPSAPGGSLRIGAAPALFATALALDDEAGGSGGDDDFADAPDASDAEMFARVEKYQMQASFTLSRIVA